MIRRLSENVFDVGCKQNHVGGRIMKKIVALSLVLCLILALGACGAKKSTGSDGDAKPTGSGETVKLTVWVGDNYPTVTQKMIDSFKAANPGTTYEITIGIESESSCKDTVLLDPEAAADVYTFADDQLGELVRGGAIQPVSQNTVAIKSANGAGAIEAATIDGTLYAYPMSASNGYFMYYDSRFFSADDVKSLNTMATKAAGAGKYVGMQFGADGGWYIYSFFKGAGLDMSLTDDGVTNFCEWNKAGGTDVVQGILDLVATGGFKADNTSNLVSAAKDGTVVALVDGTWDSGAIKEAFGDGYACIKLPTYKVAGKDVQMSSFAGYKLIGVNPHSKFAGEAMKLAEWLTNEANQTLRFEDQGDGPANIKAASSATVAADPAIAALATQSQFATVQRVGGNFWTPAAALGTILSNGNPDGTALQSLLDTAVAGITASPE